MASQKPDKSSKDTESWQKNRFFRLPTTHQSTIGNDRKCSLKTQPLSIKAAGGRSGRFTGHCGLTLSKRKNWKKEKKHVQQKNRSQNQCKLHIFSHQIYHFLLFFKSEASTNRTKRTKTDRFQLCLDLSDLLKIFLHMGLEAESAFVWDLGRAIERFLSKCFLKKMLHVICTLYKLGLLHELTGWDSHVSRNCFPSSVGGHSRVKRLLGRGLFWESFVLSLAVELRGSTS